LSTSAQAPRVEAERIAFLLERDGDASTVAWVRRTLGIYRRAVLDRRHFASTPEYRRRFLASCADFRRWLATHDESTPP
jgi:hypothetical protein